MKKALFLAILSAFCITIIDEFVWPTYVWAGYRGSFCSPRVSGDQLNWLHDSGGLFVGHLGSARGSWTPPPACYHPPQINDDRYPQHNSRYDRRDRRYDYDRRGNNIGESVLAGAAGGATVFVLGKLVDVLTSNQAQPPVVSTPQQYPQQPQPPQVVVIEKQIFVERERESIAPTPKSWGHRRESCGNCVFVSGGSEDARRAVKFGLKEKNYTVVNTRNNAEYEVVASEKHIGDPTVRVNLEMTRISNGEVVGMSEGQARYPTEKDPNHEIKKINAVVAAARQATDKL